MESYQWSNCTVMVLVTLSAVCGGAASRSRYWRGIGRDFSRRRIALLSSSVFALYLLAALCDSVAWRDSIPISGTDGVAAREPRSLVDRAFSTLGLVELEPGYSAPFARSAFYGESRSGAGEVLNKPRGHPLGTDILGRDVLYLTFKGARPAMMIGGFTSLIVIPVALLFGLVAGYYGGRVDDAVQYIYTTLNSIPNLLLLVALIMAMGRSTRNVCIALGITGWVGYCRLLRGEALKIREMEYIEAARALGVSHPVILFRHVLPNVGHIVIIGFILEFSGLVLSESILAYLGLGLDFSWGSMIDRARDELARDPIIWWNLASASAALFILILSVNLLGDALRDVLDPRTRRLAR